MIAPPAPRRPSPGGGLAVLVVVTVLAALAAPHATTLRGLIADALPVIAAPEPLLGPGRPRVRERLGRWRSCFASGASRTAGVPKAPAPLTARA